MRYTNDQLSKKVRDAVWKELSSRKHLVSGLPDDIERELKQALKDVILEAIRESERA